MSTLTPRQRAERQRQRYRRLDVYSFIIQHSAAKLDATGVPLESRCPECRASIIFPDSQYCRICGHWYERPPQQRPGTYARLHALHGQPIRGILDLEEQVPS